LRICAPGARWRHPDATAVDSPERRPEVLGSVVWSILGAGAAELEASTASPEWWTDDARLKAVRIALRRLHAAVQAIGPYAQPRQARALARELQLPTQALGAVRDWDVLLAELANAVTDDARLAPALDRARAERAAALAAAQRRVAGGRLRQLHSHLFRYAATCLRAPGKGLDPVLRAVLNGRSQHLAERLAALDVASQPHSTGALSTAGQPDSTDRPPDRAGEPSRAGSEPEPAEPNPAETDLAGLPELHAVRRAARQLRYGLECFAPWLSGVGSVRKRLRTAQDALGRLNDLDMLRLRLELLRRATAEPETQAALASLRDRTTGLLRRQLEHIPPTLQPLRERALLAELSAILDRSEAARPPREARSDT